MNITKEELVKQILANPVYMPESGVYKQLEQSLLKLSKDNLSNLKMIIEFKERPKTQPFKWSDI